MADWKTKLYEAYVSTEQAAAGVDVEAGLKSTDYPQLLELIRRHIPPERSIRIADLGCGHGSLIFCLRSLGYRNVEGVDLSPEQVDLARRLGISGIRRGGLDEFLRSGTGAYDVLFLMDVLEHLQKQEVIDMLELACGALKVGGRIVLHVPNAEGLFGMRVRYGDFTHEVCFTPQSIRQVLRACGFRDVEAHEQRPVVHGVRSAVRAALWRILTVRERLLLLAETGHMGHVLSQNMLVTAKR